MSCILAAHMNYIDFITRFPDQIKSFELEMCVCVVSSLMFTV